MKSEDMVVVDLDGNVVKATYNPSSDTATHLELYKQYPEIGGVVHTHSTRAVSFAQAGPYTSFWNNSCRLFLWRYSMYKRA